MLQRIESGELSLRYNGLQCSIRFVSPTSSVRINFTSDFSVTMSGFNGTYRSNFKTFFFNLNWVLHISLYFSTHIEFTLVL